MRNCCICGRWWNRSILSDQVLEYLVALVGATRNHPAILQGGSPRATLSLAAISRSYAFLQGRDYVVPEDVQETVSGYPGPPDDSGYRGTGIQCGGTERGAARGSNAPPGTEAMTARMRILYLAVLAAFFWMFLYVDSWLAAYGLNSCSGHAGALSDRQFAGHAGMSGPGRGMQRTVLSGRGEPMANHGIQYGPAATAAREGPADDAPDIDGCYTDENHAISPPSGHIERPAAHGYQPLRHLGSRCALGAGV